MPDDAANDGELPAAGERSGWWMQLRPWIVPTARSTGWKGWLRTIGVRVVCYYLLIVAVMAFFQRELIYRPGHAKSITASDSRLPTGSVNDVTLQTADGVQLNGWHVLPSGANCETRAECDRELTNAEWVVLFFHGNGGDRRGRELDSLSFGRLGAHVFLFDYRGYGDNSGAPTEEGLAADARAVWKYVTEERHVSADRIIVYGESLGGGVAARLTAGLCKAGSPPAGLILSATFSSMTDTASSRYPWLPVGLVLLDRYESDRHVKAADCPVLQMHGTHDHIVPFAIGRKLYAAIPAESAGGIPKRFVEFPNATHNDFEEARFQAAVKSLLDQIATRRSNRESNATTGEPVS